MDKSKYRFFAYLLFFLLATGFLGYHYQINQPSSDFVKEILIPSAIAIILSSIIGIVEFYLSHRKRFWLWVKCLTYLRKTKSYVSLSYLLRIKIPGSERYFLIRGTKIDQYQPVGGVYQSSKNIYKGWGASRKEDRANPKDLRFFVQSCKIPEILNWFESGIEREVGVGREFFEELIETGILPQEEFKYVTSEYIKTEKVILKKENRFQDEKFHTLLYDIYQIELLPEQLQEFEKLLDNNKFTDSYAFVTEGEIKKGCFNNHRTPIGIHTNFII